MWKSIKETLSCILIILGVIAVVVGGVGGFIYQLTEYGRYVDFIIYNHWTTWVSIGGVVSVVLGYVCCILG